MRVDDPAGDRQPQAGAAGPRPSGPRRCGRSARTRAPPRARGCPGPRRPPRSSSCRPPRARSATRAPPAASGAPRCRAGWPRPGARARDRARTARSPGCTQTFSRTAPGSDSSHSRSACSSSGRTGKRTGRSGSAPLSMRDRSSSCATSRPSRSVCASATRSVARIGRLDAVGEVLQQRLERADRRAQLVRDVRHELPPLAVDVGELRRHRVERAGELADLVARRRPHAHVVVAARHGARRGRHLAQRRRRAAREEAHERAARSPWRRARGPAARGRAARRAAARARCPTTVATITTPSFDLDRRQPVERPHRPRLRLERVADAVHGPHPLGAELAAQPADVGVDRAVPGAVAPAPHVGEQLVAGEHHAGPRGEQREQVELGRREVHLVGADAPRGGAPGRARAARRSRSGRRARAARSTRRSSARMRATSSRGENGLVM